MGSLDLTHAPAARAVFLDRDGVINKNIFYPETSEWEAPLSVDEIAVANGAMEALRALTAAGFLLFVVSNQPNAAKGKATMETLNAIHQRLVDELTLAGVHITEFYYCYHHPRGVEPAFAIECDCRKPSPYFLLKAAQDFHMNLAQSWMVGDRDSDVASGNAAGTRTIRIVDESENGSPAANYNAADLAAAAQIILSESASG